MKLDTNASGAIPLILVILGIIGFGGIYTLVFYVTLPHLYALIPNSIFKSYIIYGIVWYAPFIVVVVGILALIQAGAKKDVTWEGT